MELTRLPLDDFDDEDIADAAFAMRHFGGWFDHGPFGVRPHSRIACGLMVLQRAGIVTMHVYAEAEGSCAVRDGLITVDVRHRKAG